MKKSLMTLFLCFVTASALAQTQEKPIRPLPYAEIFLGYSFANVDTNGLTPDRQNANGWDIALTTPLNQYVAIDYDVAGYYKTYSYSTGGIAGLPATVDLKDRDYAIFAGPRITYGPLFAHAMIGGDRISGNILGYTAAQWSIAGALGGGLQIPAGNRISFRATADYIISRHDFFGGGPSQTLGNLAFSPSGLTQNNIRVSAGIVFNVGRR
jgi:hypothetical protein